MNDFQILVKVDKLTTLTDMDVNLRAGTEEIIRPNGDTFGVDWIEYTFINGDYYYIFTAYSEQPEIDENIMYFARSSESDEYEEMDMVEWFADLGVEI